MLIRISMIVFELRMQEICVDNSLRFLELCIIFPGRYSYWNLH